MGGGEEKPPRGGREEKRDAEKVSQESHREADGRGQTFDQGMGGAEAGSTRQTDRQTDVVEEERKERALVATAAERQAARGAPGTCRSFSTSYPKLIRQALNSSGPREPPWSCQAPQAGTGGGGKREAVSSSLAGCPGQVRTGRSAKAGGLEGAQAAQAGGGRHDGAPAGGRETARPKRWGAAGTLPRKASGPCQCAGEPGRRQDGGSQDRRGAVGEDAPAGPKAEAHPGCSTGCLLCSRGANGTLSLPALNSGVGWGEAHGLRR